MESVKVLNEEDFLIMFSKKKEPKPYGDVALYFLHLIIAFMIITFTFFVVSKAMD